MVSMATPVKRKAEMKATRSPKLSIPMAKAPRMTVKLSHDRNVRSLAKKTFGSTRVGRAMRLPGAVSIGDENYGRSKIWRTLGGLEKGLGRHVGDGLLRAIEWIAALW